jgi:hypothetical protein
MGKGAWPMGYQASFERNEIKYLISQKQAENLKERMSVYMRTDEYGESVICNLYYDTPDFLLIRRSLEKPVYKEKLRLRSYGMADGNKLVFPELKKKYKGIVYKRRLAMTENEAIECLSGERPFPNTQIGKELAYCLIRYKNLVPKVFLSYEREAFYAKESRNFRMTFDRNILWRDYDLSLSKGVYGNGILAGDETLLEVKNTSALPLWLVNFLSENKIYKASFSKYGNAYLEILKIEAQKEIK